MHIYRNAVNLILQRRCLHWHLSTCVHAHACTLSPHNACVSVHRCPCAYVQYTCLYNCAPHLHCWFLLHASKHNITHTLRPYHHPCYPPYYSACSEHATGHPIKHTCAIASSAAIVCSFSFAFSVPSSSSPSSPNTLQTQHVYKLKLSSRRHQSAGAPVQKLFVGM